MILIWIVMIVLVIAVGVLFFMLLNQQQPPQSEAMTVEQLENKVQALESNLQKTLEIMQDLAKKMNVQQDVLDVNAQKLKQLEMQNAELVGLLAQVIQPKS